MTIKRVLGLDPGISSLGWALIEENDKNEAIALIDSGSLIFKSVFEPQFFKLKNQERTLKRQTRRQRDRSKRRLSKVENFLIKNSLLSKSSDDFHENNDSIQSQLGNPYFLRKEALYRLLDNDELSYAILHLFKRRGFYSSLKSKSADEKKKEASLQGVMTAMRESNCQTLGEYFCRQLQLNPSIRIRGGDHEGSLLSGEKLLRDNLYEELELILDKQIEFGNSLLMSKDSRTKAIVKNELLKQFRFQRPLKGQKRRSFCSLETKVAKIKDKKTGEVNVKIIGIKLAHKMTTSSQEFIIRQTINNLKIEEFDHDTGEIFDVEISQEDKDFFFNKSWNSVSGITFKAIRKRLGVSEHANINLEYGNKKGIQGNQLLTLFKKPLNKFYSDLSSEQQTQLINEIHMIKGAEYLGLRKRLVNYWKMDDQQVDTLIGFIEKGLKPQYLSVSKKASEKILVELRKGLIYSTACDNVYPQKLDVDVSAKNVLAQLPKFEPTMNPIVNKSVTVVRHLVNDVIRKYGKIDVIRLELARDLGLSSQGLKELRMNQSNQEKANEVAKKFLSDNNIAITKVNIDKYKLWQETNQTTLFPEKKNGQWNYANISFQDLFGSTGKFEIEHLLPQSESGDNSFMNKSLCPATINAAKGKRTPYDYYQSVMSKDELDIWIKHVYSVFKDNNKKKRFVMTRKQMLDRLSSSSSLNDTRYIARELSGYLEMVANKVETVKGGHSAMMRKELNLNILLGNSIKKSRLDYRHHMVDGLVVALSNKSNLDALTKIRRCSWFDIKNNTKVYSGLHDKINNRYKSIRKDFEVKFENTFVEHEVEDKHSGGFDEESIYSLMKKEEIVSECGHYTYAKLSKIKMADLTCIEDIDKESYKDCVFVNSKPAHTELSGKKVSYILEKVYSQKTSLPLEVIESLISLPSDKVINEQIVLKSGNVLKKVRFITAKSDSDKCHSVKNKEGQIIGIKKLGNNFCVVGFNAGKPRVVSLFEYLNNDDVDKKDVIFKGSILEDQKGERWKVYKFSGSSICVHPSNFVKVEKRDCEKYGIKESNILEKSFSFYFKNGYTKIL